MWTAVSGASAQMQNVEMVANNLANANTPGFKKDLPTFKEYLAVREREPEPQDIPRGPIKDKDFYPLDGRDQSFVVVDGTYSSFKQGALQVTNSPLDVALDGPGLIEVSTPSGTRFTRHGSLKLAMDGQLVTSEGHPVLASKPAGLAGALATAEAQPGQGGLETQGGVAVGRSPEDAARFINLRDKGPRVTINDAGEIYAGEEFIAKLSVVEFQDARKLRKTGAQLFENRDATNIVADQARTVLRQGMIETSNVNPIEEMTNLIKANRLFEHDLKVMKTFGEMLGREANDIGRL
ncbi:MAG: hypothetical protein A2X94_09595 [Bdellovibrionales bacterium GWB1_55_8]|nr:MAG: hypothetical protein A2X94_09595 [Bdellovibrionales bacterium GWB1_55_8]